MFPPSSSSQAIKMGSNYEEALKGYFLSLKYKYPDITKPDILRAIGVYTDLQPARDKFVFNNGVEKELVKLDGTIPVTYRDNRYNIPICVWLLDTHPHCAPIVYVKPTPNMQIKPGRHVDPNGKINLPFLLQWKYPQSDLYGLLNRLAEKFGEEPPVFSKVQQNPVNSSYQVDMGDWSSSNSMAQTSHPPYPTRQSPYMPSPATSSSIPPYPIPYTAPQTTASSYYPSNLNNPLPYPAHPQYPLYNTPYLGYPAYSESTSSVTTPTPMFGLNSTTSGTHLTQTVSGTSTVTEEHIKASLISAVEETLKRRLKETFAQAQAEMDTLYKTQNDLQKGRECLEKMMKSLEQEKDEVEKNISILKEKNAELKETLNKMENQGELKIDEAVVTTTPLYRQLLNAFAKEQAIEDTIYYLGEALRRSVIDLDIFLKQVRELSRHQFMLRAIIQKCREKAGLPALT
ncbi:tumor susceptibility gene 101 protein isoform X1 [Octopus bimaculoides]|uniref:UEV domain-containing protein n=2 Tax=Octopus bimaculoides TaxID=37653 RepID=A0A0L8GSG2_OCTBM|nr:tumor susceptibility gene 101 protein isoform X1 [Octopus bimaculoides]|eukprot:XP_014778370.1 PREDICTED: tumor susceptibility gene 101 protein-like [Octopus bimaculoides]